MIELLLAMSVLSIGIIAVFTLMNSGLVQIQRAASVSTAAALAEAKMENYRAIKFTAIGLDDAEVSAADATYTGDAAYRTDTPTTALQATIADTATSLTVPANPPGFPTAPPFRIKVDNEILLVTAISGGTWTVSRGQDNTVAAAHASGATVTRKQRAHLPVCGSSPCTTAHPTETVTGADNKSYRVDTYITWQLVTSSSGTTGRNTKRVTIVVRNPTTKHVFARVTSTFDEATGL
jgi:type II secretory pathway pseudopilin PulG